MGTRTCQDGGMIQQLPLPNPGDWMDHDQAAAFLGVTRRTIDRMIIKGSLTCYRIGTQRLFWCDELTRVAAARKVLAI